MTFTKKIILPKDQDQKDYVLFLYKNRTRYHSMNDKDLNNLMKLMSEGKLEDDEYPLLKKSRNVQKVLEGFRI